MKIGYYIPSRKVTWSKRRQFMQWDSIEGLEFVESLFSNGNLSFPEVSKGLPPRQGYKPSARFDSLEHFFSVLREHNNQDIKYIEELESDLRVLKRRFWELEKRWSNHENNLLTDKSFQSKRDNILKQCEGLANLIKELRLDLEAGKPEPLKYYDCDRGYFDNCWSLFDLIEDKEVEDKPIPFRGFRLTEHVYDPADLFYELGYNNDLLKNDMKLLKEINSKVRNNRNKTLNTFYRVTRTNNHNDILYLSVNRTKWTKGRIILVFKTHEYVYKRGSDYVYFTKFYENGDGIISLIVADRNQEVVNEAGVEVGYGLLNIFDPITGKGMKSDHPTIRGLRKSLRFNYALEGYKLSNRLVKNTKNENFQIYIARGVKRNLKYVENGLMGSPCLACDMVPCDCQTILDWENYRNLAPNNVPDWGFHIERDFEQGTSGREIDLSPRYNGYLEGLHHAEIDRLHSETWENNLKTSGRDEYGLDWSRFNGQLDMDQQGPEFW